MVWKDEVVLEEVEEIAGRLREEEEGKLKGDSTEKVRYLHYVDHRSQPCEKPVVRETAWRLFVNGQELVTLLCTPNKMNFLVLGFLASEGIIKSLDDVALLRLCEEEGNIIDVRLKMEEVALPQQKVLLSGCGGGVTFDDFAANHPPLSSSLRISTKQLSSLMRGLYRQAEVYQRAGGTHASSLSDGVRLLVIAEDVGRHNTLDKIRGECLYKGIPTKDRILLTTGRISSEMVKKAAGMEVPLIASRTSPTDLAIRLAEAWGITVVGYIRGESMNVYTWPERVTKERRGLRWPPDLPNDF